MGLHNARGILTLACLLSCGDAEPSRNDGSVREDASASDANGANAADANAHDGAMPLDAALGETNDAGTTSPDGEVGSDDASAGCMPNAELLWGGGRTLSTCQDGCRFEVGLSPVVVPDLGGCVGYWALLEVQDERGEKLYSVDAELSSLAWSDASRAGTAIRGENLAPSPSCDGCESPVWLSLVDDMLDSDPVDYHFARAAPPSELAPANAFVQKLIDQMLACEGEYLTTCVRNER
jgi:hypothetical protein